MKTQTHSSTKNRGFTLVHTLITIAIIGIIAGMSMEVYSNMPASVGKQKIHNDIRTINAAIDVYRAFGGDLSTVETAEDVIVKLQSRADSVSAQQIAGVSGSLIDRRLKPVLLPSDEAGSSKERIVWDATKQHLVVSTEGSNGIAAFEIDNERAGEAVVEETRAPSLKPATAGDWIWEYGDSDAGTPSGPTQILNTYATSGSGGGGSGGGGGGGGGTNPSATPLDPPEFSIPTGSYLITEYDLLLSLDNPNPSGVSRIIFQVNGGAWSAYNGTPIVVNPEDEVMAYTESIDPDWTNSGNVSNEYDVTPVKLDEPILMASASEFDVEVHPTVTVTISDPNSPDVSKVRYRLSGQPWQDYDGEPVELDVYDHPDGVTVYAKAEATALYYLDSDNSSVPVEEPDPITLVDPVISLSAPKFDYDDNADVVVTISNPNESAVSRIEYRVGESTWLNYDGPFTVNVMNYQVAPAPIKARAKATDPFYEDSGVANASITEPDTLFTISGDSDGVFTNAEGGRRMETNLGNGQSSSYFEWGDGVYGTDPSSLLFNGDEFVDVSQGERFLLGSLDYFNGTIWSGTGADSVDLNVDLEFWDGTSTNNFDFTINLLNTVNTSNQWDSADYVKLINVYSDTTTTINDRDYQLRIEFGETTEDGFSLVDEFHVFEDATARGYLYGTLWLADEF